MKFTHKKWSTSEPMIFFQIGLTFLLNIFTLCTYIHTLYSHRRWLMTTLPFNSSALLFSVSHIIIPLFELSSPFPPATNFSSSSSLFLHPQSGPNTKASYNTINTYTYTYIHIHTTARNAETFIVPDRRTTYQFDATACTKQLPRWFQ